MAKVLDPDAVRRLLKPLPKAERRDSQNAQDAMESVIIPTAEDLLALTQAAIGDVGGLLVLTPAQEAALRQALRRRVADAMGVAAEPEGARQDRPVHAS